MPNYVTNTIICRKDLLAKMLDGEGNIDFNILIPEPETEEKCRADYGAEYLDSVDENGRSVNSLDHSEGKPWFNWYKWHCDFWGTKWGGFDTAQREENGYTILTFDTAWSPPMPWIEKLASLGKPFIFYWEEEQGFGESMSFNGATTIGSSWDIPEYDENGDPIYDDEEDRELPSSDTLKDFFGDK